MTRKIVMLSSKNFMSFLINGENDNRILCTLPRLDAIHFAEIVKSLLDNDSVDIDEDELETSRMHINVTLTGLSIIIRCMDKIREKAVEFGIAKMLCQDLIDEIKKINENINPKLGCPEEKNVPWILSDFKSKENSVLSDFFEK